MLLLYSASTAARAPSKYFAMPSGLENSFISRAFLEASVNSSARCRHATFWSGPVARPVASSTPGRTLTFKLSPTKGVPWVAS
jgi:hypothetical protein